MGVMCQCHSVSRSGGRCTEVARYWRQEACGSLSEGQGDEHLFFMSTRVAPVPDMMTHHCPERFPLPCCAGHSLQDHRSAKWGVPCQNARRSADTAIRGLTAPSVPRSQWYMLIKPGNSTQNTERWTSPGTLKTEAPNYPVRNTNVCYTHLAWDLTLFLLPKLHPSWSSNPFPLFCSL